MTFGKKVRSKKMVTMYIFGIFNVYYKMGESLKYQSLKKISDGINY
jgi:hypothetical protein